MTRRLPILLILSLVLTGCWDNREITETAFIIALAVDRDGDRYRLTAQIIEPSQGAEATARKAWHLSSLGRTITEAARHLNLKAQRKVDMGHTRVILLSEGLAREGIDEVLDFATRSGEVRPTAWLAVVEGEAHRILMTPTGLESISAMGILGNQGETIEVESLVPAMRSHAVIRTLGTDGIDLALPRLRLVPAVSAATDSSDQEILMAGAAVFRGSRMVDWLTVQESRGLLWGQGRVWQSSVTVRCPEDEQDQYATFDIRRSRTSYSVQASAAQVSIQVTADLIFHGCSGNPSELGHSGRLQQALAAEIKSDMESAITSSRRTGSDFLGLGRSIFRSQPAVWARLKDGWHDGLQDLPVTVTARAEIQLLGMRRSGGS